MIGQFFNFRVEHVCATLYAREINCGCGTFWDGGIKVWIGDTMNGHHAETMFSRENIGKLPNPLVVLWMLATSIFTFYFGYWFLERYRNVIVDVI